MEKSTAKCPPLLFPITTPTHKICCEKEMGVQYLICFSCFKPTSFPLDIVKCIPSPNLYAEASILYFLIYLSNWCSTCY